MIELTEDDRRDLARVCKEYAMALSYEHYKAIYRAGLAAGIERAAQKMDAEIGPGSRAAAAIRALLK
jgi:hypothetical protein